MNDTKGFRDELLKADGVSPGGVSAESRDVLQRLLRTQSARVARMKMLTILAWSLLAAAYGACMILRNTRIFAAEDFGPYANFTIYALFYVALAFTISYVIRSQKMRSQEVRADLTCIEARLTEIEEALRRMRTAGKNGA